MRRENSFIYFEQQFYIYVRLEVKFDVGITDELDSILFIQLLSRLKNKKKETIKTYVQLVTIGQQLQLNLKSYSFLLLIDDQTESQQFYRTNSYLFH